MNDMKQNLKIYKNKKGNIIGFEVWHKINGEWRHLVQFFDKNEYYTDGILEKSKRR